MEFNEAEVKLIKKAAVNVKRGKYIEILLFVVLCVFAALAFVKLVAPDHFAYIAMAISMFALFKPNIAVKPSYEDLVKLLQSKAISKDSLIEEIISMSPHMK
jgi:hypothetical protein